MWTRVFMMERFLTFEFFFLVLEKYEWRTDRSEKKKMIKPDRCRMGLRIQDDQTQKHKTLKPKNTGHTNKEITEYSDPKCINSNPKKQESNPKIREMRAQDYRTGLGHEKDRNRGREPTQ